MALLARISEEAPDRRGRIAARRTLSLQVPAVSSGKASEALIHNLSQYGLRVETAAPLCVDEIISVELPEAGPVDAKVIWTGESSAGCRFLSAVSKAAVSAALLRSPALNGAHVGPWEAELPLIGVEQAAEIERIEIAYEEGSRSNALTLAALLVSFVVSALFILALLRMAVPD